MSQYMRHNVQMLKPTVSGVGVIDKSVAIFDALEAGPLALTDLASATGLHRATAHRLATALEQHRLLGRDAEGRFQLGWRLGTLGRVAGNRQMLEAAASPLAELRDTTGESVQLFIREGEMRRCVLSLESPHGLRTIVREGERLPLDRGSGGRVLAGAVSADGWLESVEERESGVASVSAAVVDTHGTAVAAVSVSAPIGRVGSEPGKRHGAAVVAAARKVSDALAASG